MEQVPLVKYTIIGDGRVARHFDRYLELLGLRYNRWRRGSEEALNAMVKESTHVLALISDGAIEGFLRENAEILKGKVCVHFSGSVSCPLAYGAHPLMSFAEELYSFGDYKQIPFICEKEGPNVEELLPGLPNPSHQIPKTMKARYHALCVMSNNFSTLLWQKFYKELGGELELPESVVHPYMERTFRNLMNGNARTALTGPLARGDLGTIEANLKALEGDPFREIYEAFVNLHKKI